MERNSLRRAVWLTTKFWNERRRGEDMWTTRKMTVKVCGRCSNVDVARLKACGRQEGLRVRVGCIGRCRRNHPELVGLSFGLVDGAFVACPDEDAFIGGLRRTRGGIAMGRRMRVVGIVVAVVAVIVVGCCALLSGSPEGDEERLARELTPEEQAIVEENVFTPETLAEFDGKDGRPAYVAVNGVVYDVTETWKNGEHHGLTAGCDQTEGFLRSPHGHATLQGLKVVGGYRDVG